MFVLFLMGTAFTYADTTDVCKQNTDEYNKYFQMVSDSPEEIFEDDSGVIQFYPKVDNIGGKYLYRVRVEYDVGKKGYLSYLKKIKKITALTKGKSDAEKVRIINDWIQKHVTYGEDYTAYDTIMKGSAVCEGYAAAFRVLADSAGLENRFIRGVSEGEGHAWNIVKIDGKWYGVDTCWNVILQGKKFNKKHEAPGDYKYTLAQHNYSPKGD